MGTTRRRSIYDKVFSGNYFDGVLVLQKLHFPKTGQYGAVFRCHCGKVFERLFGNVKRGQRDCNDCSSYRSNKSKFTIKDRRLYRIWKAMNYRCHSPDHPSYEDYGGRGIHVCDSWRDHSEEGFNNFYQGVGMYPTTSHTLDRIDVDKGYSSDNCRWATSKVQANNKRDNHYIKWEGVDYTIQGLGEELGIKPNTLLYRLRRGWSLEEAISGVKLTPWKRPLSKLTDEQFDELLVAYFRKGVNCYRLSREYKVDSGNLSRLLKRKDIIKYYQEELK